MLPKRIPLWKLFVILSVVFVITICAITLINNAHAEQEEVWVLCNPDSFVNVRTKPSTRSMILGSAYCGDRIVIDGKTKNGYIHCIDLSLEMSEGWIHSGYIVYDKPDCSKILQCSIQSDGRVAARKTIDGKRNKWVKKNSTVTVYAVSAEWCVTNKGFIKTEYINLGEEK